MPRPKKSAIEIKAMREQILDTADAILQEAGPEAITSRAIAERLGVAHMSLYTYFENQAAILNALREREMAKWRAKLRTFEARAHSEEILQVVREQLEMFVALPLESPNLYRLAWVMPEVTGENPQQNRQRMLATVEQLARLLDLGIQQGVFAARDPFLAASVVLGMVNTPYILFFSGRMIDPQVRDRMVDEMLSAALLYLQTPAGNAIG